ncbi:Uncharacterised protein [Bordetella pertussis]|nr:Uncharacterised protein [Bordetella pertussis]
MRLRIVAPADAALQIAFRLPPQLSVPAQQAQRRQQVGIGRTLLQPGLGLGKAVRHLGGIAARIGGHQRGVELDRHRGLENARGLVGLARVLEGGSAGQRDVRQQPLIALEVFPDGAPLVHGHACAQARGARAVDQLLGLGLADGIAPQQAARQHEHALVMLQGRLGAQQQAHGVQMARAAVLQRLQQVQRLLGAPLVQQHVGRYRGGGFLQPGILACLFAGGFQHAVPALVLAQVMRRARARQRRQDAAAAHLGLVEQLRQVLLGLRETPFQQADPAAFEQFVVAFLGTAAAPGAQAIGNGHQPGQQAQADVQRDEGGHQQQYRQRQRQLDAPRPDQQQDVARVGAQHDGQRHRDNGQQ